MRKKPFNWRGFIVIVIFIAGLIYFFGKAINPELFAISSKTNKITTDSLKTGYIGVFWLITGVICVPRIYKVFSINAILAYSLELTANVKVISKYSIISHTRMSKTNVRSAGTSPFISFEFPEGSRKNFRIKDMNQYNTIIEGEQGVLTYKEYKNNLKFLIFKRRA